MAHSIKSGEESKCIRDYFPSIHAFIHPIEISENVWHKC